MSLAGVKVGDEVVIVDRNRSGDRRAKVTAIARKYATIGGERYALETGVIADNYGHCRAYTAAEWELLQARNALESAAASLDRLRGSKFAGLSAEQIRAATSEIKSIVERLTGGAP